MRSSPESGFKRTVKFAKAKGVAKETEDVNPATPAHPAPIAKPAAMMPAMQPRYFEVISDFDINIAMSPPTTETTDEMKSISMSNTFLLCCQRCAFAQKNRNEQHFHYSVETKLKRRSEQLRSCSHCRNYIFCPA